MKRIMLGMTCIFLLLITTMGCSQKETGTSSGVSAGDVDIVMQSGGTYGTGVYEVSGEVQNNTDGDAVNIKIEISYFDEQNKEVENAEVLTKPSKLKPGKKATFKSKTSKPGAGDIVKRYKLKVSFDRLPASD